MMSLETIRREVAAKLHRRIFETLPQAYDAVAVDWNVERDAHVIRIAGMDHGVMFDESHRLWSLDDFSRRYTLDDIVFSFWSRGMDLRP